MKRTSIATFALLSLLAGLNACQAPVPSEPPSISPSYGPAPSSMPGNESLETRTESDVTARREFRQISKAWVNPSGSQVIYRESLFRQVDLRGWNLNPAISIAEGGLWLQDAQGQRRALDLGNLYNDTDIFWIDDHSIAWLSNSRVEVLRLDLATGVRSSLFKGRGLSTLSQYDGKLYFVHSPGAGEQELLRLTPSGSIERFKIPYAEFYSYSLDIKVLGADIVQLIRTKDLSQKGQYPFKVMTSPPPPVVDNFVFSLRDQQAVPFKDSLDLHSTQALSLAPDQAHYAIQQAWDGPWKVYSRAGQVLFEIAGQIHWLDAGRLLAIDNKNMSLSVRSVPGGEILYQTATQSSCPSAVAAGGGAIVQCQVLYNNQKYLPRLYSLAGPIPPGKPLQELKLELSEAGSAQVTEQGLILTQEPGVEGHAALYTLDAQGQPRRLVRLENPDQPSFSFDPKKDIWNPDLLMNPGYRGY